MNKTFLWNALFSGSFDPITLGHEDIILRGAIFDEIVIAIGKNSEKKYMFSKPSEWNLNLYSSNIPKLE